MPYSPDDYLSRHFQASGIDLKDKVDELTNLAVPPGSVNLPLYQQMLMAVARMAQADRNRWDAKIMLQTLREMEYAFSRLEQFKRRRKVTVFGSARTQPEHPLYALAHELGAALARHELMVITGAGGGIMAAAHAGAGREHSLGFNITLPFEQDANPTMQGSDNLLTFHFFFLRKLFFVKEADALVLCPGGFGTLDELFEALTLMQTGKVPYGPVILVGSVFWRGLMSWIQEQLTGNGLINAIDPKTFFIADEPEDVVAHLLDFYKEHPDILKLQPNRAV